MGRPPRDFHPDGIYHLTMHGIDDHAIFREDFDRQDFCIRFRRVVTSEGWEVHAACLMDTHYHLLIRPRLGSIPDGMKLLNGGYSRAFNKRHGRRGALFESRYDSWTIRDELHYQAAVRYIEENPIAAGMVESLEEWIWTTGTDGSPLKVSDTLPPFGALPRLAQVSDTSSKVAALRKGVRHQFEPPARAEKVSDTFSGPRGEATGTGVRHQLGSRE
ncbi:MAG: REP-associated tyrosine transposase [Gaiellaceae bacterium]|nr:REP-associated tyrosine transposase [Gaiellaceae bacterium]